MATVSEKTPDDNKKEEPSEEVVANEEDEKKKKEEEHQCFICWEIDSTEENPIRRDCGCKGSSGWVHLNCLIESAEVKGRGSMFDPIVRPWRNCSQCIQPYKEPTKRALEDRMLRDLPRLRLRIVSSIGAVLKVVLILCLYVLALGFIQKAISRPIAYSLVKGNYVLFPLLETRWSEARREVQFILFFISATLLCIAGAFVCKQIYLYRFSIGRFVRSWLLDMGARLALEVALNRERYSVIESGVYIGGPLLMLAYAAYHFRAEIRQNMIEIRHEYRRQGFLAMVSQIGFAVAFICAVVFAILIICFAFVTNVLLAYIEEVVLETMIDNPSSSIFDRTIGDLAINSSGSSEIWEFLSEILVINFGEVLPGDLEIWERKFALGGEDILNVKVVTRKPLKEAEASKERPFREDYWYCCA